MKILFFIKQHIFILVTIIILIAIQAIGIITLPEYISKIVDIGIERYGVEYAVPNIIRKTEMDKLMVFINNKEVLDNFVLENRNNEQVYVLKENIDLSSLNYSFARAETLLLIVNRDESITEMREKIKTNITTDIRSMIGKDKNSIAEIAFSATPEQLTMLNSIIDEKLSVLTEDVLLQVSSRYLVNEYKYLGIENTQMSYIIKSVSIMMTISLLIFLVNILEAYITSRFSAEFAEYFREKIYNQAMQMKDKQFDQITLSSLVNRTVYDIQVIQKAIPLFFKTLIYIPIIFIGSFYKIKKIGSGFEGTLVIAAMLIFIIGAAIFKKVVSNLRIVQKIIDEINSIARDSINNIIISKTKGRNNQTQKFNSKVALILEKNKALLEIKNLGTVLMMFAVYMVSIYILWNGAIRIEAQTLMIGSLIAIVEYLFQISFMTISILRQSTNLVKGFISFKRCKKILKDEEIEINVKLENVDKIQSIEFKNIYFKYPNTSKYVLENFNLKIDNKDKIAITGRNASGKSTIIKLLLKFYEPEKGEILINGININNINIQSLRNNVSVVLQHSDVFSGDLNDNIRLGNINITEEKIKEIKKIAHLTEFENDNKQILYKGKNISGGQKQRIAIARALAKNASVIIFDEAYSSLDVKTKKTVQNNIIKYCSNQIIIDIGQDINERLQYNKLVEI